MKKILLILLSCCFAFASLNAQNAQIRAMFQNKNYFGNHLLTTNVAKSDNIWWIGSGSNSATITFHFCNSGNPIGIQYGYKWDNTKTVQNMLDEIANADENFSYNQSSGFVNDVAFSDNNYSLIIEGGMLMYLIDGNYAGGLTDVLTNNCNFDLYEFAFDDNCEIPFSDDITYHPSDPNAPEPTTYTVSGTVLDNENNPLADVLINCNQSTTTTAADGTYSFTVEANATYTVNPSLSGYTFEPESTIVNVVDADVTGIDFVGTADAVVPEEDASATLNDVIYWVGNGSNYALVAVNWCDPEIALLWGVRFEGENAIVADLMHTIDLYDSRFSYTTNAWGIENILFQNAEHNLTLVGNFWMYNVNGATAMLGFNEQTVSNGDLIKWGDENCGIADENYNYIWTTAIQAVNIIGATNEVFSGTVESEGCQAIYFEDPSIVAWASSCSIERGPQNITNPTTFASYGDETMAIGPSSSSTMTAVSLGDGGVATLSFDNPIANGEGYDFAVFENSLNHTFLELAFVEVSSDGIHYYRFPSVSNSSLETQVNNGGSVDATKIHNLAGKYIVGYGTPFDLEELSGYSNLDINNITHVRIVDVVGSINPLYGTTDKNGHIINDPYPTPFESSGFDLTGVAVLNTVNSVENNFANNIYIYPNPAKDFIQIQYESENLKAQDIIFYDLSGRIVKSEKLNINNYYTQINISDLKAGIYFIKIDNKLNKIVIE